MTNNTFCDTKMKSVVILVFAVLSAQADECGILSKNRVAKGVPWQAGIYLKDPTARTGLVWKCHGSLISKKVVLTVASCLWVSSEPLIEDRHLSPSRVSVAVGVLTRPEGPANDGDTQLSDAKEIYLSPSFVLGRNDREPYYNFEDLAAVIVETGFQPNKDVQPVCLNFEAYFDYDLKYRRGEFATAVGWREEDKKSTIRVYELYPNTYGDCNDSPRLWGLYFDHAEMSRALRDKICVRTKKDEWAPCDGDVGTGLTYPGILNGTERHSLLSVYSAPIYGAQCSANGRFAFTLVQKHESFIKKSLQKSEETKELGPPQIGGKCILPPYPEHGTYTINVTLVTNTSGGEDYQLVVITVVCQKGFGVLASASVTCYNGFWPESVPKCVRMCALKPDLSVEFHCLVTAPAVGTRPCAALEPPGTLATPRCRQNYYSSDPLGFMRCREDGAWNDIPKCKPECGRLTPEAIELITGGVPAKRGELPWHAAIYDTTFKPYMQICGGSLITTSVVISAAHCFWRDLEKQLPAANYAVALGKLFRPWNDPEDAPFVQKSLVKELVLPARFQGAGSHFQDDIAAVLVAEPFTFRPHIRPVCLSFDYNFDRLQLQTINSGKVAGWGLTSANGRASPILRVLEVPYVEVGTCIAHSPRNFVEYITSDKICAGTQQSNSALCKGDSGGGLAFPSSDQGTERFYLRGIVSTAPNNDDACNTATYTSFTHVIKHDDFIQRFLTESA